jgi:murein DD-endopeptidase MepM/ murein hydrolase activator NlpD
MRIKKKRKLLVMIILLTISLFLLVICLDNPSEEKTDIPADTLPPEKDPHIEYGINLDSLTIIKDVVKRNESLSEILLQYNIGNDIIHRLANLSKPIFDVRKIRVGNPYAIILTNDSIPEPLYFIYEEDQISYITYHLHDSLSVEKIDRALTREVKITTGVIESSLWNSFVDNGGNPAIGLELSEVYAWTIDFFGIQKGDYYKVIYEDLIVEDESIGIGNILAAHFNHMDSDIYAFLFTSDDGTGYYDENGQNLQRTFLKAPLRFKRISSKFSYSRMHPVLKYRRPHLGVDYAANAGTPVVTIGDGKIIEKGWDKKGGGNYIRIRHNSAYTTLYMHLSGFAKGLQTGKKVIQGEVIGYVGSTGLSTGPHLDFRVFFNGKPIDPLKMESPPADPVGEESLSDYLLIVDSLKIGLDTLVIDF